MKTKTSTDVLTSLRQWLSLFLAFLFLATTLGWIGWLYFRSRDDVEEQVKVRFSQHQVLLQELVKLKQRELDALAQGLASSPLFKSAVSTSDRKTIVDVLNSGRIKNNLQFAGILQEKNLLYADAADGELALKSQVASRWIGRAALDVGNLAQAGLLLAKNPDGEDLAMWERVLGARLSLHRQDGSVLLASEDIKQLLAPDDVSVALEKGMTVTKDDQYYYTCLSLLGETLKVCPMIVKKDFWRAFNRLKNKLLLLGAGLGLLGMILGPLIGAMMARQLDRYLRERAHASGEFAEDVLKQIEALKQAQAGKKS